MTGAGSVTQIPEPILTVLWDKGMPKVLGTLWDDINVTESHLDWQLIDNSSEHLRVAKHLGIVSFNCFVSLGTHGGQRCSFLAGSCVFNSRCKICSHEEAQKIKIYGGFCNSGSVIWQGQRGTQVGGGSTSEKPLEGKSWQFTPRL